MFRRTTEPHDQALDFREQSFILAYHLQNDVLYKRTRLTELVVPAVQLFVWPAW
jgi:hypothetical protein